MSKAKKTYLVDDEFIIGCCVPDVCKDDDFSNVDDDDDGDGVDVAECEIIAADADCIFRRTFIRLFIFNILLLSLID